MKPLTRALVLAVAIVGVVTWPGRQNTYADSSDGDLSGAPNIVVILADDLGWADVGYHGSEVLTPNIDRLAKDGVRFERHYATPTCTPTRVGFLTGLYPSRFGVLAPAYGRIFDAGTVTLASLLRDEGYETTICGKWHMGSPSQCEPLQNGFTASYGYFHGQVDPYTHLYKNGERSWHRNDAFLDEDGHATDLITREAVRVVESATEKPFFLYVAYSVPHFPLDEPEKWRALYEETIENPSRRLFAASVSHMDWGIGRIVDALDRTGRRKSTLVVVMSDNGGQRSWHSTTQYKGRYADKPHTVLGRNLPWRGWKGQVYEGGIRVPALASWPGKLTPRRVKVPLHVVDWLPTLCHVAGVSTSKFPERDGRNVWTIIDGTMPAPELGQFAASRTLYWKTPSASGLSRGTMKLVVDRTGSHAELYDLAADPHEESDLAEKKPEVVAEMRALLGRVSQRDRSR